MDARARQELEDATRAHRAGDLAGAERVYRAMLAADPGDADAAQLLGVVCLQTGRDGEAIDLTRRALSLVAVCYSDVGKPDAVTRRLRALAHEWRETAGLRDERLAETIRRNRIDILVDLTGHMAHNRRMVFGRRPAPIQATYLRYPHTTGMPTMDYRITDALQRAKTGGPYLGSDSSKRMASNLILELGTISGFMPRGRTQKVGPKGRMCPFTARSS